MMSSTLNLSFQLSPTEQTEVHALAARFHLTDEEVLLNLMRYGLNLAQNSGDLNGESLGHLLDQRVTGHHAIVDEARQLLARLNRAIGSAEVVHNLVLNKVATLPDPLKKFG